MNNNPIRTFEEKYYKKKFKHPSYSSRSSSIIDEFELNSKDTHDKFLKEIGNRFIPEKMYETSFNPRWATELIIKNIIYIPKFSFVLDYEVTYEEICEKYSKILPFNIFNFAIHDDLSLLHLDAYGNPRPYAIGYGRVSTEDIPFNDVHHVCIKLNHRFKTLSFPAQILFMIFIANDFIAKNNRATMWLFSGLNRIGAFRYIIPRAIDTMFSRELVYNLSDARRLFYSDLVDNFTELSVKASANDSYYRKYIKELERTDKGLL